MQVLHSCRRLASVYTRVAGKLSGRVLAKGLKGLWFKPLPQHPVIEVSSSLTPSSYCCLYQNHATEAYEIGTAMHRRNNKQTLLQYAIQASHCISLHIIAICRILSQKPVSTSFIYMYFYHTILPHIVVIRCMLFAIIIT